MISILTCSYNRESYLFKLYESLLNQTNHNFEWVIIDDGSEDGTGKLIESFVRQTKEFTIRYYWQKNGGKHRAFNKGMEIVSGTWVFSVDSDDTLTQDAIETVYGWIRNLEKESDYDKFAAVSGLRMTVCGNRLGGYPKSEKYQYYIDAKNNERRKYKLTGDKAEVYKSVILRNYPFPTFDDEKFISEEVVWNKIAMDGYKIRWYPKAIYICDYLEGGLTKDNHKWVDNFKGFTYQTKISISVCKGIYIMRPISKYIYWAKMTGLTQKEIMNNLNISYRCYLVGVIIMKIYRIGNRI